jgi:ubiquinone/menaquinone biosynthesis C-methylase UbiE
MAEAKRSFIPAAGIDLLLPLYDPLVRFAMREERTRGALIDAAELRAGMRVLDLGCGTGSTSVLLAQRHPDVEIIGVDPDPKALERARAKAARAGVRIRFEQGFGDAIPCADASIDRVVSSLVIHHLTQDEKLETFADIARVLLPGGSLHVLDFGPPITALDRALSWLVHHGGRIDDNLSGRLPSLMQGAGLVEARELSKLRTLFGSLSLYGATRAA